MEGRPGSGPPNRFTDAVIAGGGLAGLALSIQLARAGYSVVLFEKEKYPFHKVCGEYISLESWNFLEELGLPLSDWKLPVIKRLMVSSPNGRVLSQDLPLGGFGISRFKMDACLADIARQAGVCVMEEARVTDIHFQDSLFSVQAAGTVYQAKIACGTFGKRSNLDIRWKRKFVEPAPGKLNNYVGVKYHIEISFPQDLIALHNFENGYCGISRIEDNRYCLCYLTTAANLKRCGNSIKKMEEQIVRKNPLLEEIFSTANFLYGQPLTISQISFAKKTQIEDHVLLIGDAAGSITPLCGNGMSMALHGSKVCFTLIDQFLQNRITRDQMEQQYRDTWNRLFGNRLQTGRIIQRFFGNRILTNFLLKIMKPFPKLVTYLIRQTHGDPY